MTDYFLFLLRQLEKYNPNMEALFSRIFSGLKNTIYHISEFKIAFKILMTYFMTI